MADLLVVPRPAKSLQTTQALAEKLEQIGPAKEGRVALAPQSEQLVRTPELLLPKGKGTEPSFQITRS